MVLLCNKQMSVASKKHRLNGTDYNIDGFVSQLLASGRFVELIDKLAEEAANRIKYNYNKKVFIVSSYIHEAPVYNEKGTKRRSKGKKYDIDGFISQVLESKNIHELLTKLIVNAASKIMRSNANTIRTGTENSYENQPKTNQVSDAKTGEELPGKVDIQAIIKQMVSLSEDLKLKYDVDESDISTKLQSKEETSETINKDHIANKQKTHKRKSVRKTFKNNVTETHKNDSKKKTIHVNKRALDDAKVHYGKTAPNRHNESSHSGHNGTGGEDRENNKKNYKSLEEQSSSQEHINSREAQNSELKVKDTLKQKTSHKDKSIKGIVKQKTSHRDKSIKGIVKQKTSHRDKSIKGIVKQKTSHRDKSNTEEENLSSLDEENHRPPPSEEKTNREVAQTKEETENRSTENIVVNLGVEDSVMNNKMVSDDNHYGEDRRSPERLQKRFLENQRFKEQSDEGQRKPIIRKEGRKLYTYVRDADYEEYHEKLSKWQKTHPKNATDFMK